MKVFINPTGLHSFAMNRVVQALRRYVPKGVEVTEHLPSADLQVAHVIAHDSLDSVNYEKPHVIIQYCLETASDGGVPWSDRWTKAKLIWSYYDLQNVTNFYYAPLGVDDTFALAALYESLGPRNGVMTSGYVSSSKGEAIEEVAWAAWMLQMPWLHLGPGNIEGMRNKYPMTVIHGVTDQALARHYRDVNWVSGLRHTEGFELPVIEGLCCGARPVVFDRPDMTQWYTGHAAFVPECDGPELVKHLLDILDSEPEPVSRDERQWVLERFNWERIIKGFWERAL